MKKLKNKITGVTGTFVRITYPTGKPQTTVILTDLGLYFAPSNEFIKE